MESGAKCLTMKRAQITSSMSLRFILITYIMTLASLSIAAIHAVPYGTPKHKVLKECSRAMILIDDNEEVGAAWETPKQRKHVLPQDFFSSIGLVWDASAPQTT